MVEPARSKSGDRSAIVNGPAQIAADYHAPESPFLCCDQKMVRPSFFHCAARRLQGKTRTPRCRSQTHHLTYRSSRVAGCQVGCHHKTMNYIV